MVAILFVKNGGTASSKTTQSSIGVTVPAGGHAAGNTLVVLVGAAAAVNLSSVTDSRGNTYTVVSPVTRAGIAWSVLGTALQAGDTVTVNLSGSAAAQAVSTIEFSGVASTQDFTALSVQTTTTTPSVGPTTPPSAADLLIGCLGITGPVEDSFTQDTDSNGGAAWAGITSVGTTGAGATSNATVRGAYKITTSAAAQTYNTTITSRSVSEILIGLQASGGGSALTKSLTDSAAPTDTTPPKTISHPLTDSAAPTETVAKAPRHLVADSAAPADAVVKAPRRVVTDSAAPSEAAAKSATHPLTDSAAPVDTIAKATGHPVTDSASPTDASAKTAGHAVTDTATSSDTLARATGKPLVDSATPSDDAAKTTRRALSETAPVSESTAKAVARPLADSVATSDVAGEAITAAEAESLTVTDELTKAAGAVSSDALAVADQVAKAPSSGFSDHVTAADALTKTTRVAQADVATVTDSAGNTIRKAFTEALTPADLFDAVKAYHLGVADSLALSEAFSKAPARPLTDAAPTADQVSSAPVIRLTDLAGAGDDLAVALVGHLLLSDTVVLLDAALGRAAAPDGAYPWFASVLDARSAIAMDDVALESGLLLDSQIQLTH